MNWHKINEVKSDKLFTLGMDTNTVVKNKGLNKSGEILSTQLNINKARKVLGWTPSYSLEKGLRNIMYSFNINN